MKIKGIIKRRTKGLKIFLAIVILSLLLLEIKMGKYHYVFITFLLFLSLFLEKEHIISEDGSNIQYNLLGKKIDNHWKWDEMDRMAIDYKKDKPNVYIYMGKKMMTRAFIFSKADSEKVKKLASELTEIEIEDISND